MNLVESTRQLLNETGPGRMTNTAYDTAWLVRLGDMEPTLSFHALDWLCEHQLSDGSWGSEAPLYYHDRVVCTLAAVLALAKQGRRLHDRGQLQRGLEALGTLTQNATKRLMADPGGATVGFEMIVPTLLADAQSMHLLNNNNGYGLRWLTPLRNKKLALLQGQPISRRVTLAHSAELAGPDAVRLIDAGDLQEANGSVANSPSATTYFALQVRPDDVKALDYLRLVVVDGAAPNAAPFDVFERTWVLWNLSLACPLDQEIVALCQPHLDYLAAAWQRGRGVGFAMNYVPTDGDDTSITFEVLSRFGRSVDIEAVLSYELDTHFRCFDLETQPSISVNIHVLSALRTAGFENRHPSIQKAVTFLRQSRVIDSFWLDKWHASPYYSTSHAIMACNGYVNDLVESAFDWIVHTQNSDGSWGYYMPTAEETAYCLQALAICQRTGRGAPKDVIQRGAIWLADHQADTFPPLWIDKCLYCPDVVVRSAILSALLLTT